MRQIDRKLATASRTLSAGTLGQLRELMAYTAGYGTAAEAMSGVRRARLSRRRIDLLARSPRPDVLRGPRSVRCAVCLPLANVMAGHRGPRPGRR